MAANKTGDTENKKIKKQPAKKATNKTPRKIVKEKKQKGILETNKPKTNRPINKVKIKTNTGHKLTPKEAKFIALYIETGNGLQSVVQAGYKVRNPQTQAYQLLAKPYIAEEITYRLDQLKKSSIASAEEVLEFYTKVMRGEEKDQFGLDAPLSERIKAGNELAKRVVDIPNKLEGKAQATVSITLDWTGMEEEDDGKDQNQESLNDGE